MEGFRIPADAMGVTHAEAEDIREPDPSAASSREEETIEMGDLRETDRAAAFREALDRVRKVLRVIGVVRALAWAADAASAVASATAAAMEDRELDSEIIGRVRASLQKLRQRMWKSGAKMKSGAQAIRREIRDPERIIFMRRTRQLKTVPADLSNLKRRKRKQLRK